MEKVGQIGFQGRVLDIYDSLEEPMFLAVDVAKLIDYSVGHTYQMLELVDDIDKVFIKASRPYADGAMPTRIKWSWFITESGLYEVLMQSRKPIAKSFKLVVKYELRKMRKEGQGFGVQEFDELANLLLDLGDWEEEE